MTPPRVTVLMAVRDGGDHLLPAVTSILEQSLRDFQFLVVEDGSGDDTWQVLQGLAARDERLLLLCNDHNIGLTASLNRGLARATGEYVARMDADDVALPERLARQVAFLDHHPAIGVLGTACDHLDEASGQRHPGAPPPLSAAELRWRLLFHNPFYHASVMFRRVLADGVPVRYDETFAVTQDYELWSRLLARTGGAVLPEVLLLHRVHDARVSFERRLEQEDNALRVAQGQLVALLPDQEWPLADVGRMRFLLSYIPMEFEAEDLRLLRRLLTVWRAFAQGGGERGELRSLRGRVVDRLLWAIPREGLGVAWRHGVLGELARLDPLAFARHWGGRLKRRVSGWERV